MRYLPLILKNCWRNKRRTSLTIVSIGVSMCLLGVMIALFHSFYLSEPPADEALRLVVRNKVSLTVAIPLSYRETIQHIPGVREVMIANWFQGTFRDNRDPKNQFARFATEPEKLFTVYSEYKIPEDQKRDFLRDRTGCVVGRNLATAFNFKVGDKIHIVGDIYPGDYEFTIRGIFDSPRSSDVMYFNKEYVDQALPERRRGQVGIFYILIDKPENSSRIAEAVDAAFRNSTAQTKTESEQAFTVGFLSLLGNVKMFLMAISGAVMFTILLVSANTMAMSVRERVREVGVLKTLGFTPGTILQLILGEACAISVAGGLIGYLISVLLMKGVADSPFGGFLPDFHLFDIPVALTCIGAAAAIGVLSSLVPALGASRISIIDALRSTD
ncbi:MAG: FtsX-like permease family protein [Candidatus Sulfopaludibacter sp.]|nr:FtsX-like permease family protein [Candidatus Sulfopaludibacter sp.]